MKWQSKEDSQKAFLKKKKKDVNIPCQIYNFHINPNPCFKKQMAIYILGCVLINLKSQSSTH